MKTEQWLTPVEQDVIMTSLWATLQILQTDSDAKRKRYLDFIYYLHEQLITFMTREEIIEILTDLVGNNILS